MWTWADDMTHDERTLLRQLRTLLLLNYSETKLIMATQAELAADLAAVTAAVAKIGAETSTTLTRVEELEAALAAAGGTTAEVDAAVQALKTQVQAVDDLIPDAAA